MGAKDLPPEWKAAEPVSREDRDALFREGGEGDRGKGLSALLSHHSNQSNVGKC